MLRIVVVAAAVLGMVGCFSDNGMTTDEPEAPPAEPTAPGAGSPAHHMPPTVGGQLAQHLYRGQRRGVDALGAWDPADEEEARSIGGRPLR